MIDLPPSAQVKLAQLEQAASDARMLAEGAKRQVDDLERSEAISAQSPLRDRLRATRESAELLQRQRYATWQDAEQLCTQVKGWVSSIPIGTVLDVVPMLRVTFTVAPRQHVLMLRQKLQRLAAEYGSILTAPTRREDSIVQAKALIAEMGLRGRPKVMADRGEFQVHLCSGQDAQGNVRHSQVMETLCWLMPGTVLDTLTREIDTLPQTAKALATVVRKRRLAELQDEMLRLQYEEESAIVTASEDGIVIPRRIEAMPAAVLGVAVKGAVTLAA